jgi:hypothetical protein
LRWASVQNLAYRSLDFPLTTVKCFAGRREEEKPAHKKLQSKA